MKDRALGVATSVVFSFVSCFWLGCSTDTFTTDDGGGGDSSTDSSTDASAPGDSIAPDVLIVDAHEEAEASTPFSCSNPPLGTLFCDDFDTQPSVSTGLNEIAFNGGLVSFDLLNFTSSPRGARVEIPSSTGTASAAATLLFQDLSAKYKTATLRAATRVHSIDDMQGIPLLSFSYSSNVANGNVIVSIGAQNKRLAVAYSEPGADGGVSVGSGVDLGPYMVDQWYVLTLVVTGGAPAQITAYVNADKTTFPAALSSPKDSTRNFQMGIDAESGVDMVVDYDDFSCGGI